MTKNQRSTKQGRGRPVSTNNVRIVPIPQEQPDARKLGRAFLALARHQTAPQIEHPLVENNHE